MWIIKQETKSLGTKFGNIAEKKFWLTNKRHWLSVLQKGGAN